MRRFALVLLLLASCKKSREDTCEQLANVGNAFANEIGKHVKGADDLVDNPEIKATMAAFKAECMTWPDAVFECMNDNDEDSPKCREAMQHVTGLVPTDVTKAPPGPAVVATADIGEVDWDGVPLSVDSDGTVIALTKTGLVSVAATGKVKWQAEMSHNDWMLVVGDYVFVGDDTTHDIVAIDADTGAAKWRAPVPAVDEYHHATTEGGAVVGTLLYVPLDDARVLSVNPTACATAKQKGCVTVAFTMADEEFDEPQIFALGNDLVFAESTGIRRISTSGEVLANIHIRGEFGGAIYAHDEKVAAVMDEELVVIDFASCGATPVVLPRKKGRMYIRGEGDCAECRTPPSGCIARAPLDDVDSITPTVLRNGSVVASNWDGPLRASGATKEWASEIDSVGELAEVGDAVVFLSRNNDDETKPLRVAALDSTAGKMKWATTLAGFPSKELTMSDEATVKTNGHWLVVGVKGHLAWIKLP